MIYASSPGDYLLVVDASGLYFRLQRNTPVPDGYSLVSEDTFGRSVFDDDGTLNPKYWSLRRIMPYSGGQPI